MAARGRGLSRQRLDKKRSVIQCQLRRGINAATASGGVRARNLGKTMTTWTGPACQRIEQRGSGVRASVTPWVRLRVRERERGDPGGLVGLDLLLGSNPSAGPFL